MGTSFYSLGLDTAAKKYRRWDGNGGKTESTFWSFHKANRQKINIKEIGLIYL